MSVPCADMTTLPLFPNNIRILSMVHCLVLLPTFQETSLGQLFDPVWSTVASPDGHYPSELRFFSKHLDNWLQQVQQYWRDKHGTLNVIRNYHPDLLDNEEVFYGRTAKTLNFSLYLVRVYVRMVVCHALAQLASKG